MEKVKGRWHGSCGECGHAFDIHPSDTPMVMCVPQKDIKDKYEKGCDYLIPKCEHVVVDPAELKGAEPLERIKKREKAGAQAE